MKNEFLEIKENTFVLLLFQCICKYIFFGGQGGGGSAYDPNFPCVKTAILLSIKLFCRSLLNNLKILFITLKYKNVSFTKASNKHDNFYFTSRLGDSFSVDSQPFFVSQFIYRVMKTIFYRLLNFLHAKISMKLLFIIQ